ncbi:MAG TPA: hypothetical protein VHE10_01455 [Candidatus Paceibacterota bacterium]|nr:hypothetical protein [Candidatus Paceibacterota bacterium]
MEKLKVYVALSLTHVKTEAEKDEVRAFMKWLPATFDVEILKWAFDLERWEPQPVADIYAYDTERVKAADLMIVLYLSNDGSDGRGGEVVNRVENGGGKPVLGFAREGVRVSRYAADCLKGAGTPIRTFKEFSETGPAISEALDRLRR